MIRRTLGLLALGTGIVLVACSDDTPVDKYASSDAFCADKAAAECKASIGVCGISDAVCEAARKQACATAGNTALGQGRTYTSSLVPDCITKTTAVYADRVIDPVKEKAYTAACEKVYAGKKKVNEACATLYECEGALLCDLDKGVCATSTVTALDKPCNNPGDTCDTGLYCQLKGAIKFCEKKSDTGQACCNPGQAQCTAAPCLEALRCDGTTCVAKKQVAEVCASNDECVSTLCDTTASSPTVKICVAKQFVSENGSCKDFGGL